MAKTAEIDQSPKVYEVGYLLIPTLAEEGVGEKAGEIVGMLEAAGMSIISSEAPKTRDLAYSVPKSIDRKRTYFSTAYFGWVKFEGAASKLAAIREKLDHNGNILRYILITTERHTITPIARRRPDSRKKGEEGVPVDEVKMEEEIDALIASTEEVNAA